MWVNDEALSLLAGGKKSLVFSTGYGPSGLPHIGTFSEVFRTTCVIKAVNKLDNSVKTKLLTVSDDMDGLRKIPDNVPNRDMLKAHLGKPLTSIPDPFGTHQSYGDNMNARLKSFLDLFGFEYEFVSATKCYKDGAYDKYILMILEKYEQVLKIMLPTLGEERQRNYSPFLPICPDTGVALQVNVVSIDKKNGTITYKRDCSDELVEIAVTGGKCKLQWKPDWGMRWAALGVDYEMHGKDLTPTAILSSKICKEIGFSPPRLFNYELFLDQDGKKISKSKGNGLTIDTWLKYGPQESLSYYLLQTPRRAKKLYLGAVIKATDDFISSVADDMSWMQDEKNPAFYVAKERNYATSGINYSLLINLAQACHPENKSTIWAFLKNYSKDLSPEKNGFLDELVGLSLQYYKEIGATDSSVKKKPNSLEVLVIKEIIHGLEELKESGCVDAEKIQALIYKIARENYENTGECFTALYEIITGSTHGPRIGSLLFIYGVENAISLLSKIIADFSAQLTC